MSIQSPNLQNWSAGKRSSPTWHNDSIRGMPAFEGMRIQEDGETSYDGKLWLPTNSILLNVIVYQVALWTDTGAVTMNVGLYDTSGTAIDADGIYTGVNMKATDLLADEMLTFYRQGGVGGAFLTAGTNTHLTDLFLPNGAELRAAITAANGDGSAGDTYVFAEYAKPLVIHEI